ncbi:MAG: hypothetical protein IJ017_07120 [Oscillospiraceae bacterium]|nr:hypothetical protein [Oscillospiraceae bacterium]
MNTFCRILSKYGENTKISYAGYETCAKTFIQPKVSSENIRHTRLGKVNDGDYYWFAPGNVLLDFEQNITVATSDGVYDLITAEKYRVYGVDSHWEGILKRRYPA